MARMMLPITMLLYRLLIQEIDKKKKKRKGLLGVHSDGLLYFLETVTRETWAKHQIADFTKCKNKKTKLVFDLNNETFEYEGEKADIALIFEQIAASRQAIEDKKAPPPKTPQEHVEKTRRYTLPSPSSFKMSPKPFSFRKSAVESPTTPKDIPLQSAIAIYNYEAVEDGELTIMEGDCLTVNDDTDPDWCLVSVQDGSKGLVPRSYIELQTNTRHMLVDGQNPRSLAEQEQEQKKIDEQTEQLQKMRILKEKEAQRELEERERIRRDQEEEIQRKLDEQEAEEELRLERERQIEQAAQKKKIELAREIEAQQQKDSVKKPQPIIPIRAPPTIPARSNVPDLPTRSNIPEIPSRPTFPGIPARPTVPGISTHQETKIEEVPVKNIQPVIPPRIPNTAPSIPNRSAEIGVKIAPPLTEIASKLVQPPILPQRPHPPVSKLSANVSEKTEAPIESNIF
jgi:hypothetical protein